MLFLCDEAVATIDPKRDFFREPIRVMAIKYQKCAREAETQDTRKLSEQYASAAVVETETAPLLGGTTSSIPRPESGSVLDKARGAVMSLASFFRKAPEKDEYAHRAARAASEPVVEIDEEKKDPGLHRRKNS